MQIIAAASTGLVDPLELDELKIRELRKKGLPGRWPMQKTVTAVPTGQIDEVLNRARAGSPIESALALPR